MKKRQINSDLTTWLPHALMLWTICSLIVCLLLSLLLSLTAYGEGIIGYGISAGSFISSFVTARLVLSSCKKKIFLNVLILSVVLIVYALLVGFIIDSSAIDISGILSLTTFTIGGSLLGSICMPGKRKRSFHVKPAT